MSKRSWCVIAAFFLFLSGHLFLTLASATVAGNKVKVGVLAHRGAATALKMWNPTAEYLSSNIPAHTFTIIPLGFQEIGPAVAQGEVDFVLANSSIYVELEARYGVSRIATLQNEGLVGDYNVFGGVIFCRSDRPDINNLEDLKGKSFLAVDATSLGGWQVAWRELKKQGLDPYRDFRRLQFTESTHDEVVYAVRDGKADAGTVRTDTLERLAEEGKIDLKGFHILNQQREKNFPYLLSTRLYPEWPLAVVRDTDGALAKQVAVALFQMPMASPAIKAAKIRSWTIPLDYQPVHDLLKELRLRPYQDYGKVTIGEIFRLYWYWIVLAMIALATMTGLTMHVLRLNKHLSHSKMLVEAARNGLEEEVRVRTEELQAANAELQKALADIKTLYGIIPICASCKKIRDDEGAWHQMESYISRHTEAQFSHGICQDCVKTLYPEYYKDDLS
ncbi:MAG: phosphate/phosphite/phosphonate ABC transporter substrate-binding protein [Desulfobulbaceae bacterium]|nr:phosphate/phosphite/phosphonate ABC transporter substrate-binding protein [Desulfobulbaceae bacterium]